MKVLFPGHNRLYKSLAVASLSLLTLNCSKGQGVRDAGAPGANDPPGIESGGDVSGSPGDKEGSGSPLLALPEVQLSGTAPGSTDSGRVSITLDRVTGQTCALLTVQSGDRAGSLHVHEVPPGPARPVLMEIPVSPPGKGCVSGSAAVGSIQSEPSRFYVDVHARDGRAERLRGSFAQRP